MTLYDLKRRNVMIADTRYLCDSWASRWCCDTCFRYLGHYTNLTLHYSRL